LGYDNTLLSMANYYGSHQEIIARFGQQLWPFIKKNKKIPNSDCPKILTKDKKIYLKTFGKILV